MNKNHAEKKKLRKKKNNSNNIQINKTTEQTKPNKLKQINMQINKKKR